MLERFDADGKVNRYAVNDELTNLATWFGKVLDDDVLNELTHYVADVLDNPDSLHPIITGRHRLTE